ncbi:ComF family protein [Pseudobutyrivibrio xylanivorans]|uniref:ComF family protein n=1 Tax=Pseudobutyrivibrio xylanivorans TaxID=185007 RepID=A0A5P6VT19_PSEXY|nr:ComF family protein [Pseudobutyrivibrio xylanivorans]QFJ54001.1 ComF family protein [Pseudobutyrivibrio xylanivorans]
MNSYLRYIIDVSLGLLYPKRCVACDNVLLKIEKEAGFCQSCQKKIRLVGKDYCLKCGAPVNNPQAEFCTSCKNASHVYTQNKAVFRYSGDMKNAMYRFKYSNKRCYGKVFAKYAVKSYGKWLQQNNIEAIIPVPMYQKKERKRGYNQAEIFAKALSDVSGIPVNSKIVRRNGDTVAMKQLNSLKRKKNLLKAFSLAKNDVQFKKVLIVDDIYTTGTTMDEVAKILRSGGVQEVYGMCVCIGETQ